MVSRRFQVLSVAGAALTANAFRPRSDRVSLVPSFFAAWLTAELAAHNLAVTVAGTTHQLARGRVRSAGDKAAVALNVATAAGLLRLISESRRVDVVVEEALAEALGDDYADDLDAELTTPWRTVAMPFTLARQAGVEVVRNLPYGTAGRRNLLDVYRHPDTPPDAPVLLQLHGGAWMIGHKGQQGIPLMHHLAARGWICVAANYPLSPRATWPEHLVELKRAIAWVRREIGGHGGDPTFVAVTGGSAGGHLAALLALTANDPRYQPGFEDADTTVQACVPHYGVYDFADDLGNPMAAERRDRFLARMVMKHSYEANPAAFGEASPLRLVHGDAPPFFVIHGRNDTLAPVGEARALVERLRSVSDAPVAYAELPGTQHAFDVFPSIRSSQVVRGVEAFLTVTHARHRAAQTMAGADAGA